MKSLDHYVETEDFQSRRPSLTVLRKVFRDLMEERALFIGGAGVIFVGMAAVLLEPRIFGYAIDEAIVPKDEQMLMRIGAFYLFAVIVRVAAVIAQSYLFEKLSQVMMQKLRLRVFSRLQNLPVATYDRTPVGKLITRITSDTASMSEMFSQGFVTLFGNLLYIVGTIFFVLTLNWKLGLIAIATFPVLLAFSAVFSRDLIAAYRNARIRIAVLNAFLAENILGMKVVHLFNREEEHFRRFTEVNDAYGDAQISSVRVYAYFQPLITWGSGIGVACVLAVGGKWALAGEIKPGELVAFVSYVLALFQPVREVVDRWTVFLSGMTAAERVYGLLEWKPEIEDEEAARPSRRAPDLGGSIVFENVWFAYEGENWILKDFSCVIETGQRIGIVGHTGAGKTTIISLLLRFYDPQKGRILIDGREIRTYSKRELRERIGLIQQDVFLFSGTLAANLRIGAAREDEISPGTRSALRDLGFAHPLSTELEERGSNLSMGERQVLSFARALESDPSIWMLDEATANVDSETERRLETALERAARGKTLILIAHRLATVRVADRILVLHQGRLVEQGNHGELLRLGGAYAKLYRYQSALERQPIDDVRAHSE